MSRKFDFENDLKQELPLVFNRFGVNISTNQSLENILLDYLTIHKKLIAPKVRDVIYSPILKGSLSSHPKKREIEYLSNMFSKGEDVNSFQSKKLFQTKFHDH